MTRFGQRLAQAMERHGHLCVGIDPHPGLLPQWGLSDDAAGLREFGLRLIDAAAGQAAAVKPQVAFFEAYGPAGMVVLGELIAGAREQGLLVVGDAKRGDIGSTMAAYAQAWLDPSSPWAVDALTVTPYLGCGSLQPAVETAAAHGAGLFVLSLTSNPEGAQVQLATHEGVDGTLKTVAGSVADFAAACNAGALQGSSGAAGAELSSAEFSGAGLGDVGLVVGATTAHLAQEHGIDLTRGRLPLLAPGYGAQGATAVQIRDSFGAAWPQVLVNSSRGIAAAGPDAAGLRAAVAAAQAELR